MMPDVIYSFGEDMLSFYDFTTTNHVVPVYAWQNMIFFSFLYSSTQEKLFLKEKKKKQAQSIYHQSEYCTTYSFWST